MMQQIKNETLKSVFKQWSSDEGIVVINPATEQELIRLKPSTLDELDDLIGQCKTEQVRWAKLSAKERSRRLRGWYQLLLDNAEDIATIITLEQGKPLAESKGEVMYGASLSSGSQKKQNVLMAKLFLPPRQIDVYLQFASLWEYALQLHLGTSLLR